MRHVVALGKTPGRAEGGYSRGGCFNSLRWRLRRHKPSSLSAWEVMSDAQARGSEQAHFFAAGAALIVATVSLSPSTFPVTTTRVPKCGFTVSWLTT
jgi:hypothetical protein